MNDNIMTATEKRATWGLGTVFALRMLGMFMVLPVLATYGLQLHGANAFLIGLAIGIYGFTQAIFQIPLGLISDKVGRKPLIILGLLVFLIGSIIAAMAESIWGIILGRALQGSGAIAAAIMALLSDLTREQNRTKAMALIGVSIGITFAVAMILGPIVVGAYGLPMLFWAIALLAFIAIFVTLYVVPRAPPPILNRECNIVKRGWRKTLFNSTLLKLNFGIFGLHTLLMSIFLALPQQLAALGFSTQQQGKIYLFTMLVAFIFIIPIIVYAEKRRRIKQVVILCVTALIIAELILWQCGAKAGFFIGGIQLFFLAFNVLEALLPSLISKESPAGYKGTSMGIYSTSQFVGVAVGGNLGGLIIGLFGIQAVFCAGVVLGLIWLIISFTMQEPPYITSMRITLDEKALGTIDLEQWFLRQPGVEAVLVIPAEKSAYIKIDNKVTNRTVLEAQLASN